MNPIKLQQDNLISTITRVSVTPRESKTGTIFHTMTIYFKNGLSIDYFVDKKDLFGLKDACSRTSTGEKIESILNEG